MRVLGLAGPTGLTKRRALAEWMLAYLAVAWIGLHATDALREIWSWPVSMSGAITLGLALGALPAGVLAWHHGERRRQRGCPGAMLAQGLKRL